MKMLVGAAAVLAALTTGGVPAVMSAVGEPERPDQAASTRSDGDGPGRPPKAKDKGPAKPEDKTADGKPGYGPPAHARSRHNGPHGRGEPGSHGQKMAGLGRAHGEAMRNWASCVNSHPGKDGKDFAPEKVCGSKPVPPGHQLRPTSRD
jgi:hypothetical protein